MILVALGAFCLAVVLTHRRRRDVAARRAVGEAATAARSGEAVLAHDPRSSWPPPVPEADAGVAAASAVGVGAAIAPTALTNGDLATPAPTGAVASAAFGLARTPARAEPTMATLPSGPPVTVQGYVRPPARETPGIIRAAVEPARPAAEPLFSNEGLLRTRKALRPSWRARILGAIAAAVASLRAAGTALGHNAGTRLSYLEASVVSMPKRARGAGAPAQTDGLRARFSDGFSQFSDTRAFAWMTSATLVVRVVAVGVGSALAAVLRPIVLGFGRRISPQANAVRRWAGSGWSGPPDSDEYGDPRKKRRVSPFWVVFAGSCVLLGLTIGTNLVLSPASAASSQAPGAGVTTPTPYVAGGGSGSSPLAVRTNAGRSSSTGGGVINKGSPSAGASSTPTDAPTPMP
ncbi:MAG: hypothetical protein ACHQ01_07230, partial [Candidatus Limnocylindrales bacterium]